MSVEDLIPYVPGQSGNPAGRRKGVKDGIAACARRLLAKDLGYADIIEKLQKKGFDMSDKRSSNVIATVAVAKALTVTPRLSNSLTNMKKTLPSVLSKMKNQLSTSRWCRRRTESN